MRRQDTNLFNRLFDAIETGKAYLDPHLSLTKLSVIVGTAITQL